MTATPDHRRTTTLALASLALAGLMLGGCSSSRWSPTGDALAGANRRAAQLARAESPQSGGQMVVLSQDSYGRMATPTSVTNSSNTTATAGVDTAE